MQRVTRAARVTGIVLATSMACAAFARAADEDLHLGVTNKLDYRRLDQDDVREDAFRDRLEVTATRGPFDLWLRFESLQVSDAGVYDPFGLFPEGAALGTRVDETEVTKRSFTFRQESLRATVGDASLVFGRGLLFAVFEDEELNFDNRPEGLFVDFEPTLGRARPRAKTGIDSAGCSSSRMRGVRSVSVRDSSRCGGAERTRSSRTGSRIRGDSPR
jgi:hypothetical protein